MTLSDAALHLPIPNLPGVTMTTLRYRVPRPATAGAHIGASVTMR